MLREFYEGKPFEGEEWVTKQSTSAKFIRLVRSSHFRCRLRWMFDIAILHIIEFTEGSCVSIAVGLKPRNEDHHHASRLSGGYYSTGVRARRLVAGFTSAQQLSLALVGCFWCILKARSRPGDQSALTPGNNAHVSNRYCLIFYGSVHLLRICAKSPIKNAHISIASVLRFNH